MAVYTETKTYHTKAHMGMIDVTEDFQHAVSEACKKHGITAGTVTGFTTGGVAGLTTLEFEPGMVNHDLKAALDVFSPNLKRIAYPMEYAIRSIQLDKLVALIVALIVAFVRIGERPSRGLLSTRALLRLFALRLVASKILIVRQ